ncbi:MAG: hypothetical protein C5B60_08915 [Chloroflexi bacterium]|nr:MAG: hypothetical protein C5B60_08915 [Chloroflexota bacterium]
MGSIGIAPNITPEQAQAAFDALKQTFQSGMAKYNPYQTQLSPADESQFQQWVQANRIPYVDSPTADYDMRGFWQGMQQGDPAAKGAINPYDMQYHFPDKWKTPYHETFSNESQYATADAPRWTGNDTLGWVLQDRFGNVVKDERTPGQLTLQQLMARPDVLRRMLTP